MLMLQLSSAGGIVAYYPMMSITPQSDWLEI